MNTLNLAFLACTLIACSGSVSTIGDPQGGTSGGTSSSGGQRGGGDTTVSNPVTPAPTSTTNPAPAGASPCVETTHALCAKACACTGGGACVISYPNAIGTEEHDSLGDCNNYFEYLVCGGQPADAKAYADPACGAALAVAACISTKSKGNALDLPAACFAPK